MYMFIHTYTYVCMQTYMFIHVYTKGLRMKAALSAELSDSSKGGAVTRTPVSAPAPLCPAATEHLLPCSKPCGHGSGTLGQQEPVASSSSSALRGAGPSTQEISCYWSNKTKPHGVLQLSILKRPQAWSYDRASMF